MRKLKRLRKLVMQAMFISAAYGAAFVAHAADEIRIEIPVMPALERYVDLLAFPGFFGVALENNGLSPSMSSKLQVRERGRALEIRNATLRYSSKKGAVYAYEAAITLNLGVSESKLAFPVTVDLARVSSGKIVVTARPPLAGLLPAELTDRIRIKASLIANATTQQKMIEYLDGFSKTGSAGGEGMSALVELIMVDAYNKGSGPVVKGERDAGEAVPLSDQWMLLLTLVIWLLIVPAYLLFQRIRGRRNEMRRAA